MVKTDAVVNAGGFRVSCDATRVGRFLAETDSLWVRVGQRILRRGTQELWDSIAVEGKKEPDGSLVTRVLVFNPDWDEPLQIACIRMPHPFGLQPRSGLALSSSWCDYIQKVSEQTSHFRKEEKRDIDEISRYSTGQRFCISPRRKSDCRTG
jgi:hypothetical protein